jgi:translation initiation factor IF-2
MMLQTKEAIGRMLKQLGTIIFAINKVDRDA